MADSGPVVPRAAVTDDERAVLDAVDAVPVGRVTTYGRVADVVRQATGRGSPRTVGRVLARHGADTDWFRVLFADGRLPPDADLARAALAAEGVSVLEGRVRPLADFLWSGGPVSGEQRSRCKRLDS